MNSNQHWIRRGLLGGLLAGLLVLGCLGVAVVSFSAGAMRDGFGPRAIAGGRFAPQPPAAEAPTDPRQPERRRGPRRIDPGDGWRNDPGLRNDRRGFGFLGGLFRGLLALGVLASIGLIVLLTTRALRRAPATATVAPVATPPASVSIDPASDAARKADDASDVVI
jgi:hypothetical protein